MPKSGQYWSIESEWSIEILNGRFGGQLRYKVRFYILFIEKRKNTVSSLPRALFTLALTSALQSRHLTLVFFDHQEQNKITIQPNSVNFIILRQ